MWSNTLLSCPRGHLWEEPAPAQRVEGGVLCPQCGLAMTRASAGGAADQAPATAPPPDSHTPADLPPTREASAPAAHRGRFRVLRVHARGGLGQVSLARDEELGREVALKEIRPELSEQPSSRQRFLNEARITGQLEHPNIVPIYALGREADGRPYYAMRFVKGRSLHDAIKTYHAAPTPQALRDLLRHFVEVCQAVAYAHSQGIIHRDLKPSNVMLGDFGETLVVDWGIAKRIDDPPEPLELVEPGSAEPGLGTLAAITVAGQALGTRAYMAPEQQADAAAAGPTADVYSLGVMLREIIRSPAAGGKPERGFRPLAAVAQKAAAPLPSDRYAAASELARDVERVLAGEPAAAYREPVVARCGRWGRRHRVVVAAAAVLLVTASVASTVSSVLIARQRDAKGVALSEAQRQRAAAEAARAEAEAVSRFLSEDLLATATPEVSSRSDLTVREALDNAARAVGEKFNGQPLTEAAVRDAIGRTYLTLEYDDLARPHLDAALKVRRDLLGPDHPATIASMFASVELDVFDMSEPDDELVSRVGETLERAERVLGRDDEITLRCLATLADIESQQGLHQQAESRARDALERQRRKTGDENGLSLKLVGTVQSALVAAGKGIEAKALGAESFERIRRVHGRDHPLTLMQQLMAPRGESDAERELDLRDAVDRHRRVFGRDDYRTLNAMLSLGAMLMQRDDLEGAERCFRDVVRLSYGRADRHTSITVRATSSLAAITRRKSGSEASVAMLRDLTRECEKTLGEMHEVTTTARLFWINSAEAGKDTEGVLSLYRESYDIARRVKGDDSVEAGEAAGKIGYLLEQKNDLDGAEAWDRENLARLRRRIGEGDTRYQSMKVHFVRLLLKNKKFDEADALLAELLSRAGNVTAADGRSMGFLRNLAETFTSRGDPAKARICYGRLLDLRRATVSEDSHHTQQAVSYLLNLLKKQKDFAAAEVLLRDTLERRRKAVGDAHPLTLATLADLGEAVGAQGRVAEALPMFETLYRRAPGSSLSAVEIANAMSWYGPLLVRLERHAEAEEPLRRTYDAYMAADAPQAPRMRPVLESLATLCSATDRPGEAKRWREAFAAHFPTTRGTTLPSGVVVFDDFEVGQGRFNEPPWLAERFGPASGSSKGFIATSLARRSTKERFDGLASQEIVINVDPQYEWKNLAKGFSYRHLSNLGEPGRNVRMGTSGWIGFYAKTERAGVQVSPLLDENLAKDPPVLEQGKPIELKADGRWHLYQWDLGGNESWVSFVAGNGKLDGPVTTLDALYFTSSAHADAVIHVDRIFYSPHSPVPDAPSSADVAVAASGATAGIATTRPAPPAH